MVGNKARRPARHCPPQEQARPGRLPHCDHVRGSRLGRVRGDLRGQLETTGSLPAFLRAFAQGESTAGALRLGLATIEGEPVAAQVWSVEAQTAFIHKLAHRPQASRASPGTLLTAALMRHVIDIDRVAHVDFGTGDDPYKADWMDDVRPRWRLRAHNPRALIRAPIRHWRDWPDLARGLARLATGRTRLAPPPVMIKGPFKCLIQPPCLHSGNRIRAAQPSGPGSGAFGRARGCLHPRHRAVRRPARTRSMAVAGLFTALEDRFAFILEDDEIDGDLVESFGSLTAFVTRKLGVTQDHA
jgi:hypothetical protein